MLIGSRGFAGRRGQWGGISSTQIASLLLVAIASYAVPGRAAEPGLFERSIEELGELRVVSVSRRREPVRNAPSAVYVITSEDIRRSGFTSLPEILRLAPGVEVARNGSHAWTISIRGFNDNLSNKLLVLIDGRSVYSPLYAGVFWDAQDTLIEDIDRIEIISGPGSTLWGANAVNGVINIITRSATTTRGLLVSAGAGDEEQASGGIRYGWDVNGDIAARAYLKYSERDAARSPAGGSAFDQWRTARAGFRMDWTLTGSDQFRVQGDVYDARLSDLLRGDFTLGTLPGPDTPGNIDIDGYNLLARWLRRTDEDTSIRLHAYLDHTDRDIPGSFSERRDTLDIDFQQQFRAGIHKLVWGAGFRWTSDDLDNTLFATFIPEERDDETYRLFVQDEMGLLSDRLFLTVGLDLNHNDYTGFEAHPNLRLTWPLSDRHTVWAAVTRAVRIPARLNTDLVLSAPFELPGGVPLYFNIFGSDAYQSEELLATEFGYRALLRDSLSIDIALFQNDYDNLQTQEVGAPMVVGDPPAYIILPGTLANGMRGNTRGGTLVAKWQALPDWRIQLQYAYLDFDLRLKPGSLDENALSVAGNSPKHQAAVHSYLGLPASLELYTGLRYTDELPSFGIPDRLALDLSLGWRPRDDLRIALTVRDLNDDDHVEFGGSSLIERSAYLTATWTR